MLQNHVGVLDMFVVMVMVMIVTVTARSAEGLIFLSPKVMPLTTVCNTHLLCEIGLTYTFMLYLDYVFIVFRGLKLHVNIIIIILRGYGVILILLIVAFVLSINCLVTCNNHT
jgi:hypothetical protein